MTERPRDACMFQYSRDVISGNLSKLAFLEERWVKRKFQTAVGVAH